MLIVGGVDEVVPGDVGEEVVAGGFIGDEVGLGVEDGVSLVKDLGGEGVGDGG